MSGGVSYLRRLLPCALMLALTAVAMPAAAQEWQVNKAQSRVSMQISVDGQPVEGRFGNYRFDIRFDPEEPGEGEFAATLDAASLATGEATRDALLYAPEWLNTAAYPAIRLASTAIKETADHSYRMNADLTLKGMTKRLAIPLTVEDEGTAGKIHAEIRIPRASFGIGHASAGDDMLIIIDLTATHLTN